MFAILSGALVGAFLTSIGAIGSTGAAAPVEDAAAAARWIVEHGIPIRPDDGGGTGAAADHNAEDSPEDSSEDNPEDNRDLDALSRSLEGVQMVLLGEPSYGDGAAFLAKSRLIRYLHQHHGFDVLAWQSGTFDCEMMQRELADPQRHTDAAASFGVYSVWGASAQVLPIFDYARESLDSARPLTLCGFDCVVTARGGELLPAEILNRLPRDNPPLLTPKQVNAFREAHRRLFTPPYVAVGSQVARDQQALADVRAMLLSDDAATRLGLTADATATLVVAIDNYLTESRMRVLMQAPDTVLDAQNLRQDRLAENLIWLARERFKDRKIIVWCTNQDMIRDLAGIESGGAGDEFANFRTFGEPLYRELGDAMFSIAFTALGGEHGIVAGQPAALEPSPEGSLEAIAMAAGDWDQLYLDLRAVRGEDPSADPAADRGADQEGTAAEDPDRDQESAPHGAASPLDEKLLARPIAYVPFRARWPRHVDALFVIREMTPSTFRNP